nr:ATP-binding protein [Rubellimicrobium arenae]
MQQIATAGRKLALLGERNRAIAQRARAASRAKSTFLATMSHEIRTPLNGIIGTAELLAHSTLSPDQMRQLSMIRESGYHLLEVISDVLDFSKLESGKVEFEHQRVRLPDVAETLLTMLVPRADLKGLRLNVDLPRIELGTDPARLRQVMVNLIGNAIKFTAAGSITAHGRLIAPDRLRVEILDTGIGIPAEAMPLLFRDFSQVDGSASRSFGGTGLGLAICKRIVEGLGGRIGVSSAPRAGSTFWFEIPVLDPAVCDDVPAPVAAPDTCGQGTFRGRVLVVEDNPVNRAVAKGLLEWLGLTVEMAHDGAEAVERLSSECFDLVLMDVQMPVMSGLEATQELRRRGNRVRIVGLTGNAFVSDRADCLRVGMDDFVPKPVTQQKLVQALTESGLRRPDCDEAAPAGPEPTSQGGQAVETPATASVAETASPEVAHLDAGLVEALTAALGADTVDVLLGDILVEAEALPAVLGDPGLTPQRMDTVLHSFKGAAATLGLVDAATRAQALRQAADWTEADVEAILASTRIGVRMAKDLVGASPGAQAAA